MLKKIKNRLSRSLDASSALTLVVGTIVGSAIFLVPAEVTHHTPFPKVAVAVWILAGLVSLLGALNFAELAAAFPKSGGSYIYFREAFGPVSAYVYGWAIALIIQPGGIAAEAAGLAKFLPYLVPTSEFTLKCLESLVLIVFTFINLQNVTLGNLVQNISTGLKIFILVVLGILAWVAPLSSPPAASVSAAFNSVSGSAIGLALIAAFWGFDGWANLSYIAGEVKEPGKNLPKSFAWGIIAATGIFVLINGALYRVLPVSQIAKSTFPVGEMASALAGNAALYFVLFCVGLCTLTCMNSSILSGARMAHAMAQRGDLPAWLGYVHPKNAVPTNALIFQSAITLVLLWSGGYVALFTYVMSATFAFYALTAISLMVLRKKQPDLERPYRVPLYPWLTLLYLIFAVLFLINTMHTRPRESLLGFAIILLGVPAYYIGRHFKGKKPENELLTRASQL